MSDEQLAEALAFCGNSLLSPMTQTSSIGLDPSFWRNFPAFDDERVAAATEGLAQWTKRFGESTEGKVLIRLWRAPLSIRGCSWGRHRRPRRHGKLCIARTAMLRKR